MSMYVFLFLSYALIEINISTRWIKTTTEKKLSTETN